VHGSDANAGTSPSRAFQNITALPTINAGQSVGLADGSHWRQQLTINAANVTVTGYGSGALPILDGSDVIPNSSFTKTPGFTNVYNIATTTFIEGAQSAWVNMWETGGPSDSSTGTFLANETSVTAVDSTACSYYVPTMTTSFMPTAEPIYVHSCDGSSPIADAYTYEFANRAAGLFMSGLNGNISNIEGRKSAYNDGAIELEGQGNSYVANGIIARDGGKHVMLVGGGSTVENSTLIDSYYGAGGIGNLLVAFDGTGQGLPVNSINNIFQDDQKVDGSNFNTAIIAHTASGSLGTVTSNGDWFIGKNGAHFDGISVANTPNLVVENDRASQMYTMVGLDENASITNSQFYNSFVPATTDTQFMLFLAPNLTVSISGVQMCGSPFNQFIQANQTNSSLTISNSPMYVSANASFFFEGFIPSNANLALTVNNGDFGSADGNVPPYFLAGSGATFTGGETGNANIYETPITKFTLNNTNYSTIATWQTAVSPQDASAATTGSNAAAACTLPTLPSVN
jgi:hypothetical protein